MSENQEFISSQQCFIVYDNLSRKTALSIRNRLSAKGLKCVAWDEKHFRDKEFELSNYDRLLFLNDRIANDYLANPEINKEILDFVIYKREGRVASLTIGDKKAKFNKLIKELEARYVLMQPTVVKFDEKDDRISEIERLTPEEIARSFELAIHKNENTSAQLLSHISVSELSDKVKRASDYLAPLIDDCDYGVSPIAASLIGAALVCYRKIGDTNSSSKCKEILFLASALVFEKDLINDFINAQ